MPAITPKSVLYGVGALGGVYFVGTQMKDFKTPGIRSLEERHTVAGGAPGHQPAQRTKMGSKDQVVGMQEEMKGVGSKYAKENITNQKPEPSAAGKKWNATHLDNEDGVRS